MTSRKKRYIPFEALIPGKIERGWGVLDTKTNTLVERAGETERLPHTWAAARAKELNEKD